MPRREMQRSLLIVIALPEPLSPPGLAAPIALVVAGTVLQQGACYCWVAASCRHVEGGVATSFLRTQQLPAGSARATHRQVQCHAAARQRTNHVRAAGFNTFAQLGIGDSIRCRGVPIAAHVVQEGRQLRGAAELGAQVEGVLATLLVLQRE
eukprot:COSAG06_NODE_1492_length_9279_cov_835.540632_8_plen_152_part_00